MQPTAIIQLAKKLLLKTAQGWLFGNAPEGFVESFAPLNIKIKTKIAAEESLDGVFFFVENKTELKAALPEIISVSKPETICWIAYPKKSSGIVSDLEMTGDWTEIEKYGLRIVSAASIDETWTALRLRPIDEVKTSTISNAAIQNNELAVFIDTKNKIVTLPDDVKATLKTEPKAFEIYQKLAYSHQKEYIIWILSAKQEKTRTSRVLKMIEKLLEMR